MSPLEFAEALVVDLRAQYPSAPPPDLAQLGDLVVDCQGTFVTILSTSEQDIAGTASNCDPVEMCDVVAAIARDCANVAREDGTTDHVLMTQVSEQMDLDAVALRDWADKLYAASWFRLGHPTLTFIIQGGIATVTMNVTLPLP